MIARDWPVPCVVVDVTDFDTMTAAPVGGGVQLGKKSPTVLQPSRDVAEREALRLAARNPGRHFLVLEACIVARAVKVPTHITLGGKVVAESLRPSLIALADDPNALPF